MLAAATVLLGLLCLGMAVDLGRYYLAQRTLQRTANMAALDAARVAGGCVGSIPDAAAAATAEAQASVTRNGGDAAWVGNGVRLGRLEGYDSVRYFDPVFDEKNRAVEVRLTRDAPGRLMPLPGGDGPQTLTAVAAAYSAPSATVQMGTQVVNVNTSGQTQLNKLLTGLLGAPVNLSVLTYQSFLDAQIPVAGLVERLGIGTPDELQDGVSARTLLGALVAELNALGATTAATGAQTLYNLASTTQQVIPASILGINDPVSPTVLSAADIIMAVSQTAAAGQLINVPVGLPAPLNGLLQLSLIQPGTPTFLVPGGIDLFPENFASNTQVTLTTATPVTLSVPINLLGLVNLNVASNLPLFVQAGKGTAEVDHINCARRGQAQDLAYVRAQTGILGVGIGQFSNITTPNPTPQRATVVDTQVTILGIVPVRIRASAYAYVQLASANNILPQPFTEGQTQHLGTPRLSQISGSLATSQIDVTIDQLQVIGSFPLLTGSINAILGVLSPALKLVLQQQIVSLLTSLADQSVLPLLDQAGVTVGGADVTVTQIDAAEPYLFTR